MYRYQQQQRTLLSSMMKMAITSSFDQSMMVNQKIPTSFVVMIQMNRSKSSYVKSNRVLNVVPNVNRQSYNEKHFEVI